MIIPPAIAKLCFDNEVDGKLTRFLQFRGRLHLIRFAKREECQSRAHTFVLNDSVPTQYAELEPTLRFCCKK